MPHVFISYVREDADSVERLSHELRIGGVSVWLDREQLRPGARWQDAIRQAIEGGAFFLAMFSRNSAARDRTYMNEELAVAIGEMRRRSRGRAWFLPVLLNPGTLPALPIGPGETLHDIHYVALYSDWEGGVQRLIDVIMGAGGVGAEDQARPALALGREPEVLRDPTGRLWVVCGGARFEAPDGATVARLFGTATARHVGAIELETIPLVPRDGVLLREEHGPIYVVYGGARIHIPDPWVLSRLWDLDDIECNLWRGALRHLPTVPRDGTLLEEEADPRVWEITGGRRRLCDSPGDRSVGRLWHGSLARFPPEVLG
jgi:TIR domain